MEKKCRVARRSLIFGFALAGCVVAVLLWIIFGAERVPGGVKLKGAKEYTFGDFTFSNVHCINDYVEFQQRTYVSSSSQNAAVATAPDGTVYFLAVTASGDDRMETATLYRMEAKDWTELYSYQIYRDVAREGAGHFLSVFCDEKSRVFLFNYTMSSNKLEARLYDPKTGECTLVDESRNISFYQINGRVCSDGEKVYFACSSLNNPWCNTLVYDLTTMKFSISGIGLSGNGLFRELVHREGKTYLLVNEIQEDFDGLSNVGPVVYCFENYGTDEQICVFRREMDRKDTVGISIGSFGGISVDDAGNIYVIYTSRNFSESLEMKYVLEVLSPNGECLYINEYNRIQQEYQNADICSFFFGADGELYILEQARDLGSQYCVVGRFSGEKYEILEAVTNAVVLDEEVIVSTMQKHSTDPAKNGWIVDFICADSVGEPWDRYSYMRLRMK